jgi:hypothetical protein
MAGTPPAPSKAFGRRLALGVLAGALLVVGPTAYTLIQGMNFPPDTTPEGAYLRLVLAVRDDHLEAAFAYLETEAQWGCFTIRDYRKKAFDLVEQSYPEPERGRLLEQYRRAAASKDAADFFAREAHARGWVARLRRDLSGVASVEVQGERATVETSRKTRYAFRRRENGIWGLTLFTAELRAEAQAAARDFSVVERAAADYRAAQ